MIELHCFFALFLKQKKMKRNGDIIFETYLASIEDTFDLKTKERRTILDDMELLIIGLKELGLSESFFIEYGK